MLLELEKPNADYKKLSYWTELSLIIQEFHLHLTSGLDGS